MLSASSSIANVSTHKRLGREAIASRLRTGPKPTNNMAIFVEDRRATQRLTPHEDFSLGSTGIHIMGIGQGMVDINATVEDEVLERLELSQGCRRVLPSIDDRSWVLSTLEDEECPTELSAGGSLANSLVAIGQLSRAAANFAVGGSSLTIGMGGSCGNDHLGQYFASQLERSGVTVNSEVGGSTGTVLVLTDNTGERSFLSYFGEAKDLEISEELKHSVSQAHYVVIEGYLWEMPGAMEAIKNIISVARLSMSQVVLTAGDPGVVQRHKAEIMEVLALGVDVLFCNMEEAIQLLGEGQEEKVTCSVAAQQLSTVVGTAIVTDGGSGSSVGQMGSVIDTLPAQTSRGVVSTNGAGDAYCGGFLFALSQGYSNRIAASFASHVAAAVVGRHHAQLCEEDADMLVKLLPQQRVSRMASLADSLALI